MTYPLEKGVTKRDNLFSVNASGIGQGLQVSASAMAMAGNDINKTIALLTGGSELTQAPVEMGNAIKILSLRLRGKHYMPPYHESDMLCA